MKRIPDEVSGSAGPAVENWARSFWSTTSESPDLPPHHPDCLGCGPQNPHGHALSVQRDENGVVAHHVFDQRHVGGTRDSTRRRGGDRSRRSVRLPALHSG